MYMIFASWRLLFLLLLLLQRLVMVLNALSCATALLSSLLWYTHCISFGWYGIFSVARCWSYMTLTRETYAHITDIFCLLLPFHSSTFAFVEILLMYSMGSIFGLVIRNWKFKSNACVCLGLFLFVLRRCLCAVWPCIYSTSFIELLRLLLLYYCIIRIYTLFFLFISRLTQFVGWHSPNDHDDLLFIYFHLCRFFCASTVSGSVRLLLLLLV